KQTPPALLETSTGHSVRCLLYTPQAPTTAATDDTASRSNPLSRSTPGINTRTTLLKVQNLSVRFPMRKGLLQRTSAYFQAVDKVSFHLAAGQTLALVGESGSGKTTVGKAIVQLLRDQAQIEGSAHLAGNDLFGLQGAALQKARRAIQIIFQDPFASLDPR